MTEAKNNKNCKVCFFMILVSVLFFIVLGAHVWLTIQKVRTGHGFEFIYISPKFVTTYISALMFYIFFAVFLLLLPLIYWFSIREERDFKKKYKIDEQ